MKIEEILSKIYALSIEMRTVPSSHDRKIQTLVKECNRKIGSWRKALFLSGVIQDQRKKRYPQLYFEKRGTDYVLSERSKNLLKKISRNNPCMKEKIL